MKILFDNCVLPDFKTNRLESGKIIIENDKILDILNSNSSFELSNFDKIIDCANNIVSPGFIDVHSHSDLAALNKAIINPKFRQGITTEVVGNCGMSVTPVTAENKNDWSKMYQSIWGNENVNWEWTDTKSYLSKIKECSWNKIETLIGYSTLRFYISGLSPEPYNSEKLKKMEALIEREFVNGALGISIGIGYPPNIFAQKNEYELLAKLAAKHNKLLVAHIRDEGEGILDSIDEIVSFAKKTPCKIHISHLKAYGRKNWIKTDAILRKIDEYNKTFDITFDSYPYTAGSTTLTSILPPVLLQHPKKELLLKLQEKETRAFIKKSIINGLNGWENYGRTVEFENIVPTGLQSKTYAQYEGNGLVELAELFKADVIDVLCDIIIAENGNASMIMHSMNEENVIQIFKHPKHIAGSDGLFSAKPHPRTFGAFPRIISRFCNELKVIDVMTALNQMTKFPAERFGLKNIGELKKGNFADLTIFDINQIRDTADYFQPCNFPEGINYIIINGEIRL